VRAFLGFVRKEALHLRRDRQTLAILLLFPVVQVLLFGYAVRTDVQDIAIAIVDPTPDVATTELRERIAASDRFHIVRVAASTRKLELWFRQGSIRQALVLPRDVERRIGRGDSLPVQLLTDGSDPNTGGIMQGYATAIVAGKVMPYIGLSFVSVLLVLVVAWSVFGVPLRGSLALLLAESGLYIVTALALGIVISTVVPNQRTAMIAALAGLLLPTLVLSGFIFPIDSLPRPLQWLSQVVPARWFLTIVRGIMLKGAGLATLWQETLVLVGMTLLLLARGSRGLAIRLG
jgi:hypothetical protein